jgi:hypothetical protein
MPDFALHGTMCKRFAKQEKNKILMISMDSKVNDESKEIENGGKRNSV